MHLILDLARQEILARLPHDCLRPKRENGELLFRKAGRQSAKGLQPVGRVTAARNEPAPSARDASQLIEQHAVGLGIFGGGLV